MRKFQTIIFSKDRAFQLDLCLASLMYNVGTYKTSVIYCASNPRHQEAYEKIQALYPLVEFYNDFGLPDKFDYAFRYILTQADNSLLVVDDTIFFREVTSTHVDEICQYLKNSSIFGVSLRLGANTQYCFPTNKYQPLVSALYEKNWLLMNWKEGTGDFNYPFDVSSSIYRSDFILSLIGEETIRNPNHLESFVYAKVMNDQENYDNYICMFPLSVACSIPLNSVQTEQQENRIVENGYPAAFLLKMFLEGKRSSLIELLDEIRLLVPHSAHINANIL